MGVTYDAFDVGLKGSFSFLHGLFFADDQDEFAVLVGVVWKHDSSACRVTDLLYVSTILTN